MKKIYSVVFGLLGICLSLFSQSPVISINQGPINEVLDGSETISIKIPISNTGNRDLNWNLDKFVQPIFFQKNDSANWLLTVNQDRLSPTIWITRQNSRGIYNQFLEDGFVSTSPEGTLWAYGNSADLTIDDYDTWTATNEWYPLRMLNRPMSIFLPEYDESIDITFHKWTDNARGGGFSYTRSGFAPWLYLQNRLGMLLPGETDTLVVVLDASKAYGGKYTADIVVKSNDQVNPEIHIPVSVEINHDAEFSLSENALNFGDVVISDTAVLPVVIGNTGFGEMIISNVVSKTGAYSYETLPDTLTGNSISQRTIKFNPAETVEYFDTLIFYTNSAIQPTDTLFVSGSGLPHGILSVDTDTIEFSMVSGDVESVIIQLSNTGAADLEWSIKPSLNKAPVIFTKKDYADYTNPVNQDFISPNLIITRANNEGIFNIAMEESFTTGSPANSFWSFGLTRDISQFDYIEWRDAVSSDPPSMVNNPIAMLCYTDMKFFDIVFSNWTSGNNGGGFSYARTEVPGWLKASSYNGILTPSESMDITVLIDAGLVPAGSHKAYIEIMTSNPEQKRTLIPVIIDVTGEPLMVLDSTEINFYSTQTGTVDSVQFKIDNKQLGILEISALSNQLPEFSFKPENLSVQPWHSGIVTVYFKPDEAGMFNDTLWITSNFADSVHYAVPINGFAIFPPDIEVTAEPLTDTIDYNDFSVKLITIKNNGDSDLEWSILTELPGSNVSFEKMDWADWTLTANQDSIGEDLRITRKNDQGLFNIAVEMDYDWAVSPVGTLWAWGKTRDADPMLYTSWRDANGGNPPSMVGNIMSMNYVAENRYFDIAFHSWTENGLGGGFSYTRTEIPIWLKVVEIEGTIAPGDSVILPVILDAKNTTGGAYHADLKIISNDPSNKMLMLPAELVVLGAPEILVNDTINFGFIPLRQRTEQLEISNTGTDTLRITSLYANDKFIIDGEPMVISPGKTKIVEIAVLPQESGIAVDTLFISSNDETTPVAKVILKGTVVDDPVVFNPEELYYYLPSDTTIYDSVVVKNISSESIWINTVGTLSPGDSTKYPLSILTDNLNDSIYLSTIDIEIEIPGMPVFVYEVPVTVEIFDFEQVGELSDTVVNEGYGAIDIDLATKFRTYRNNVPSFIVISSNTGVATATVANSILRITEVGPGQSMITVRADDQYGQIIYIDFMLLDNAGPSISAIEDQVVTEGFGSSTINLSDYFSDPEDQLLTYEATSGNTGVVTVNVSGANLTITGTGTGISNITVTGTDPYGLQASDEFTFTVNEATGLSEFTAVKAVVYPNPSAGIVHVKFSVDNEEDVTIKINDMNGRIVYTTVNKISGEPITLNLSSLDKGLYIMSYTIAGKINRTKINMIE